MLSNSSASGTAASLGRRENLVEEFNSIFFVEDFTQSEATPGGTSPTFINEEEVYHDLISSEPEERVRGATFLF